MLSRREADELVRRSSAELMPEAARLRDEAHGDRVTFSPKVFIPLTMLCRDRCGYCTFAKPPARLDHRLPPARRGARDRAGGRGARLSRGAVHARRGARRTATRRRGEWLADHGYASTVDYLVAAAAAVLEETGLLPHANAGALSRAELERLRAVSPSQGMMIETLAARLARARRPAPRRARQDRRAPPRDPRGRRRGPHPVHHRDPRRHRRDPRRAHRRAARRSATRTNATATCRR